MLLVYEKNMVQHRFSHGGFPSKGSTIDGSSSKLFENSWCICRWGLSVPNASCCLRGQRKNPWRSAPLEEYHPMPPNKPNIHSDLYGLYWGYILLLLIYIYIYRIIHPNVTLMVICIRDLIYQYHEFG